MSSSRKTFVIIIIAITTTGILFTLSEQLDENKNKILDQIYFDAIYIETDNIIEISFIDKSNNTKTVILEILGMEETFHKELVLTGESKFIERVNLDYLPKYGWKTIPVIIEVEHLDYGKFGLKTEIYISGDLKPKVILEEK